jgi:hypothetical protein
MVDNMEVENAYLGLALGTGGFERNLQVVITGVLGFDT